MPQARKQKPSGRASEQKLLVARTAGWYNYLVVLAQRFLKNSTTALIIILVCGSCMFPPYDEDLSLAMLTTRNLHEEATVGPVRIYSGPDFAAEDLRFIPDKANLKQGFILLEQEQERPHLFFVRDDNQLFEDFTNPGAFDYNTGSDMELSCLALPVPAAPPPGILLAHLNIQQLFVAPQYLLNIFELDPFIPGITNPPAAVDIDVIFDNGTALGPVVITPDFISANIYPNPGFAFDQIQFLLRDAIWPYLYYEVVWDINETGCFASTAVRGSLSVTLPVIGEGCFYYYDAFSGAGGTGIVSQYWDGRYLNYKWDNTNLNEPELLDIPYRIEALLSSGELFCRGDNMGAVYTQGGDEVSSFPMGALKFVYELYDSASSAYKMIFVMPYSVGSHDDREIYFKVYSIPTADIKELD